MPDNEMGHGYEMMIFDQGEDYSGKVNCTVIRKPSHKASTRGILYIHGFSDYFFQKEMAETFAKHGWNFYAVDLRRYGRSLREGQRPFEVRDLREYFDDIRAGLAAMERDGVDEVVLMGHSTGGLTCSLYMQCDPDERIKGLILNSPFLTWNVQGLKGALGIPLMSALGRKSIQMKHRTSAQTINFKKAQKELRQRRGYLHKCTVCGVTDQDNPDMEFRYCSKCSGYYCYCANHINNHTHVQ